MRRPKRQQTVPKHQDKERTRLEAGYTFDSSLGAVCAFQHIPQDEAAEMSEAGQSVFVVETIHWTRDARRKGLVAHNRYFVMPFKAALGLAAAIAIAEAGGVEEEVVAIRPANEEEEWEYYQLSGYYADKMPQAVAAIADHPNG